MLSSRLREAVVCHPLSERKTANYDRVSLLIDGVGRYLRRAAGWRTNEMQDSDVKALADAARTLHDALVISAENPRLDLVIKKNSGKIRNFRKMLMKYAEAKTGAELAAVVKSQTTKSSDAWTKFSEWARFVLSVIASVDSEVEGQFDHAGFHVVLVTARDNEWNEESVARLRQTIERAAAKVRRAGMSNVVYGMLYAYPSHQLPAGTATGHSALASYSPKRDTMNLAVGKSIFDDDDDQVIRNFIHELGHRAYFRFVQSRTRSAWTDFFEGSKGTPDLSDIIKRWEAHAEKEKHGRYLGHYLSALRKSGDPHAKSDAMWLQMVADNIDIKEKFDPYTGSPKGKDPPGLDQLVAKKSQVNVFLHPVTAYSGKNAEEAFAETFSEYVYYGPRKIPDVVRHAFRQTVPGIREATEVGLAGELLTALH